MERSCNFKSELIKMIKDPDVELIIQVLMVGFNVILGIVQVEDLQMIIEKLLDRKEL